MRLLLLALLLMPAAARAGTIINERGVHSRPQQLHVLGAIDPGWVGGSLWFSVPLVADGFIKPVNESFHIELGGHMMLLFRGGGGLGFMPLIGVRWDFHLTHDWTVFAAAKAGYELPLDGKKPGLAGDGSVGAFLELDKSLWLRLEAGAQGLLRIGVALRL